LSLRILNRAEHVIYRDAERVDRTFRLISGKDNCRSTLQECSGALLNGKPVNELWAHGGTWARTGGHAAAGKDGEIPKPIPAKTIAVANFRNIIILHF
jgi:hypothetical protein